MAYEVRAGQGSAFVNKNKTEDWHAPYNGEVMLPNGDIHYLDIKPAKTKAGENWFAIKIGKQKQPKQQQDNQYVQEKPIDMERFRLKPTPNAFDNNDDIPF
jgi:hypothetical protein